MIDVKTYMEVHLTLFYPTVPVLILVMENICCISGVRVCYRIEHENELNAVGVWLSKHDYLSD